MDRKFPSFWPLAGHPTGNRKVLIGFTSSKKTVKKVSLKTLIIT